MEQKPRIYIAPSVLSADFANLAQEVSRFGGADFIHVDVMDGHFVPNITVGPAVVSALRRVAPVPLDVHLMIENPDRYLADFAAAGATLLTVHAEACRNLFRTLGEIRRLGMRPGVALNPATPLSLVEAVLGEADLVLIMTVEPGFGGQALIRPTLTKVRALRDLLAKRGLALFVEVDGGISSKTAAEVAYAGANLLVAGSAVFGAEDPTLAVEEIRRAAAGAAAEWTSNGVTSSGVGCD